MRLEEALESAEAETKVECDGVFLIWPCGERDLSKVVRIPVEALFSEDWAYEYQLKDPELAKAIEGLCESMAEAEIVIDSETDEKLIH